MSLNIALIGAKGRMGQAITAAAPEFGAAIIAGLDIGDDLAAGIQKADAVIDFSFHKTTAEVIRLAVGHKKPLVVGTTGHSAEEKSRLAAEAAKIPCVWASNYSVGVNVLFALTRRASQVLGPDFDVEVIEMHHRFKKDAPSGTATSLLDIILEERKLSADSLRHGRQGITGERKSTEVGIHALRGGDVVGDHTVMFAALGERLELTHRATDRAILARGALRAAQWIVGKKAGVYEMLDVLGLK